ncbi:MAG: hypothetical protein LBG62_02380 [Candidatus Methanoplasma sp.]|jgi:hypothetical protein|nr:hypothetical protein [Candidatus Methanoplasma sp.]
MISALSVILYAPYCIGFIFAAYCAAMVPILEPDTYVRKNVLTASYIARFPGLGHIYVGMRRRAMLFFAMDSLVLTSLLLFAVSDDDLLLLSNFAAMALGAYFMSVVDAERLCNEMYEGGTIRSRFHLMYFSITAACYLIIMAVIAGIACTGGMVDPWQYAIVGGMWTAAMALATHRYLRTRHLDPPKGWMTA